jgi:choline monooxygenase
MAVRLEPVGVNRTVEHLELYYVGEAALDDGFAQIRSANLRAWKQVFAEDVGVVERMQRGRASPAFDGGVFSPVMDVPTHCFHKWAAQRLM